MWLCVPYSPPVFLHWQGALASPRSHYCMNVTECVVVPSLLLSLQMALPLRRSHYRTNVTVCFVFPSPLMCLQTAFDSLRFHYCMTVAVYFVFPSPFLCLQMAFASPQSHSFLTAGVPIFDCTDLHRGWTLRVTCMPFRVFIYAPVISLPHEFPHLLLFVPGWRKVNWELQVGWRLRAARMWVCVMYSSPLFLHWQMQKKMVFASSRSDCMNVTVRFVFPSFLLGLQIAFSSLRSHYRMNVPLSFDFPTPPFVFANGFRFTAVPFIFDCMSSNICYCA